MKQFFTILILLSCLSLSARDRVFTITKGKKVAKMTVHESDENGLHSYTFDYGDSKTSKTVDSNYRSIRWDVESKEQKTNLSVVAKDDGYHVDGIYKGKEVHKVIQKEGHKVWMQGMGYCGGHFLKPGESYEYTNISMHNLKAYDMRAVYVGQEVRDGVQVHHFYLSPKGGLSKFWKAHYYYDTKTGDLIAQHAVEGFPGTPETVWALEK